VGPLKNTQTALIATIPGRGTVTALLYPRLKTEKPPKVTWLDGGKGVEIESAFGKDCVFAASEAKREKKLEGLTALPQGGSIYNCPSHSADGTATPWFAFNDTGADVLTGDPNVNARIRFAAGAVAVHPLSVETPVTVVWQSPVSGTVSVEGRVRDLNPGVNKQYPEKSDGVIAEIRKGKETLARLEVPHGSAEMKLTADRISVRKGDLVRLAILVNKSPWFDMTGIDMNVRSDDGREWNLAESLQKGKKLANDLPTGKAGAVWWACGGDGESMDSRLLEPVPIPELTAFGRKVRFRGTVGSAQFRKGSVTLSLGEAGEIRAGKHKLASDVPARKREAL